ncbi:NAD(P)H-binding protein [Streptomyces sp. NPDC048483]|uniref:NAD(P)H-binding protein n=1 Tax=Streptomyces sp. NPDC048483 TaxID=3154927 RepID=UPI00342B3BC4
MSKKEILVLGGTGKVGSRVVAQLQERGVPVRAASRSGRTRFDWDDESTWGPAVEGVDAAFVVCLEGRSDSSQLARAFVEFAVSKGVRRLVLLSARGVENHQDLLVPEQSVRASGAEWTILRPSWFAQNFTELPLFTAAIEAGELALPTGDGLEPFIDAEDIAAVGVAALTEEGHAGQTYEMTGPRLLTFETAVQEIATATGREVRFVTLEPEEYTARLSALGASGDEIMLMDGLFAAIREGRQAHLSDGVPRALGREPRDFGAYVERVAVEDAHRRAGTDSARPA